MMRLLVELAVACMVFASVVFLVTTTYKMITKEDKKDSE